MHGVPSEAQVAPLYGEQTRLALGNFATHGRTLSDVPELIHAYALVKSAAAQANVRLGVLDPVIGAAIVAAADAIAAGDHDDQFPIALIQGGGGTSTNMNINEVIAALASQRLGADGSGTDKVHPNDHVNRSQSTNDSYPTAMAIAVVNLVQPTLVTLKLLTESLLAKAAERAELTHLGRTCLQDAVPLTVGETHRGQAHGVARAATALRQAADALLAVPLGATAIGTGIGSPPGYAELAVELLRDLAGVDVSVAEDPFDALSNLDTYSAVANAGVRAALVVAKIAADLRLLSSGPVGGLGEITLPALQAGSSIMPGKVNPVVPEYVMQLSYRIRGAAATVDAAIAGGELELNIMEPVILDGLCTVLTDLREAARVLAVSCVNGLVWNDDAVSANLAGSLHNLVELAADSGYDTATEAAREARVVSASRSTRVPDGSALSGPSAELIQVKE